MSMLTVARSAPWLTAAPEAAAGWSRGARLTAASALVAGGALSAVADVAVPTYDDQASRFAAMAEDPAPFRIATLFDLLGLPFLLASVIVLLLLARHRSPRLAWVGGSLATAGVLGLAVAMGIEMVELVALDEAADVATVQRLDDAVVASWFVAPVVALFLAAYPGLLILAVALWRSAAVPRGALLLLVVFLVADLGFLGPIPSPVVIWMAALVWMASSVLRAGPSPEG
jgi:hypothetical protein